MFSGVIRVASSRTIAAPPQQVFDFLDLPKNHQRITPALAESRELGRLASGGTRASYVYRILGVPLSGEIRAVVHDSPEKLGYEMSGAVSGTIDIRIHREGEGTSLVRYVGTFDLRPRWLMALMRPLLSAYNRRQIEALLANLEAAVC